MTFNEKCTFLHRMDALIRRKGTGSPKELSLRLETSEKTIYRCLDLLKTYYEAPLRYCKHRETYYYDDEKFVLNL